MLPWAFPTPLLLCPPPSSQTGWHRTSPWCSSPPFLTLPPLVYSLMQMTSLTSYRYLSARHTDCRLSLYSSSSSSKLANGHIGRGCQAVLNRAHLPKTSVRVELWLGSELQVILRRRCKRRQGLPALQGLPKSLPDLCGNVGQPPVLYRAVLELKKVLLLAFAGFQMSAAPGGRGPPGNFFKT